jgi:hypothetical protein
MSTNVTEFAPSTDLQTARCLELEWVVQIQYYRSVVLTLVNGPRTKPCGTPAFIYSLLSDSTIINPNNLTSIAEIASY